MTVGYRQRKGGLMDERKEIIVEMTNEEYREELRIIFEGVNENYKLRWFYRFIIEKLRSSS